MAWNLRWQRVGQPDSRKHEGAARHCLFQDQTVLHFLGGISNRVTADPALPSLGYSASEWTCAEQQPLAATVTTFEAAT
jgi:hypothetical protein